VVAASLKKKQEAPFAFGAQKEEREKGDGERRSSTPTISSSSSL